MQFHRHLAPARRVWRPAPPRQHRLRAGHKPTPHLPVSAAQGGAACLQLPAAGPTWWCLLVLAYSLSNCNGTCDTDPSSTAWEQVQLCSWLSCILLHRTLLAHSRHSTESALLCSALLMCARGAPLLQGRAHLWAGQRCGILCHGGREEAVPEMPDSDQASSAAHWRHSWQLPLVLKVYCEAALHPRGVAFLLPRRPALWGHCQPGCMP